MGPPAGNMPPALARRVPRPGTCPLPSPAGELTPSSGDLTPSAGESTPSAGELTPSAGELTPSVGELTPSAGELTPSADELTPSVGAEHQPAPERAARSGGILGHGPADEHTGQRHPRLRRVPHQGKHTHTRTHAHTHALSISADKTGELRLNVYDMFVPFKVDNTVSMLFKSLL
eukprot:544197-Prorocentrum_minimum.AAC.1